MKVGSANSGGGPQTHGVPWAVYQALQDKYDALVREVMAMKREGFMPSPSVSAPAQSPDLPKIVREAITALGVDPVTERHLVKQAWELLRTEEPEFVAKKITEGEPVEL